MKNAVDRIEEFSRFGSILGLERMNELLDRLGRPQESLKIIHVAGTNGKGSVCRFLYEVLQANGYRTGLYTSPFIEFFNERIEAEGRYISDEDLEKHTDEVLECVAGMVAEGHESPTEFEVITAIALQFFKERALDFVVLETGLGGRGDSTNVAEHPLIDIITSISYDHMDRLGDTLEKIAWEKAGIIKEGTPVVINVDDHGAAAVLAREAYKKGCVLHDASRIRPEVAELSRNGSRFSAVIGETQYADVEISMAGEHQVDNAVTALAAIEILRKNSIINMKRPQLYEGMKKAFQKGRFEIIEGDPEYILDGAHNREGMESLVKAMDDIMPGKKPLVIIGILADKAVDEILDMASYLSDDFIASEPDSPRKLSAQILCSKLKERGKNCLEAGSPADAITAAEKAGYDTVVCTGSLYLIGAVRRIIKNG